MNMFAAPKTISRFITVLVLLTFIGHAQAKVEDCLGQNTDNGVPGQAVCTSPIATEWDYALCDNQAPYAGRIAAWCMVSGGTWIDLYNGCPGATPAGDGNLAPRSEAFAWLVRPGACMASATPSGWGQSISAYHCWTGSPVSQNGILVRDYQSIPVAGKSLDSEERCEVPWTEPIYAMRTRSLECPAGTRSRTKSNGDLECWYLPADRCEETAGSNTPLAGGASSLANGKSCSSNLVGNPINVGSLNKVQREEDLPMMPGGLSFTRHFNSASLIPVHPETTRTTWDYWRHTYMRSIIEPYNNNGSILGVARRENGYLDYYDINGNPATKNGSSKLQKNANGWILTRSNGDQEYYDIEGKLIRIAPLTGNEQVLTYSDESTPEDIAPYANLLIEVTDRYGKSLLFAYNEEGLLSSMVDPAGNEYLYLYDDDNNLSQIVYPDETTRTYLYENESFPHILTGIVDHNGIRLSTYTYNSKGEAVSTERAGVEAYSVSGTSPATLSRVTTVFNPLGGKIIKSYTNQGGVLRPVQTNWYQCVGTSCTSTGYGQYTYDASGNVSRYRDKNGNYTQYTYDASRNLETRRVEGLNSSQATTPATRTISTEWHTTLRLPIRIAEPNLITTTTYDSAGRVLTRTQQATDDADGSQGFAANLTGAARTWTNSYNAQGQLIATQDPANTVTTYTYYPDNDACTGCRGQIRTIINALGHTTIYNAYDALGRLLESIDPNGVKTCFAYDWRGNILSRTDAADTASASTTYYQTFTDPDDVSQTIKRTIHPDGSIIDYHYDAANRLIAVSDTQGNKIEYTLDAMGNRLAENIYDPQGTLKRYSSQTVDAFGTVKEQRDALNHATGYTHDALGNITRITDPLNRNTSHQYDTRSRLTQTTDAMGGVIKYGYDKQDRITEVTDPRGLITRYAYNGFGDLISQQSPDTGATTYQYDNAGRLVSSTDAKGQTTIYQYDNLGRLSQSQVGNLITTYTYDQGANALGRLSQITDPSGTTQYSYDVFGNVVQKQQTTNNRTWAVSYQYQNNQPTQTTYPSGTTVNYQYTDGQITGIAVNNTNLITAITREPFGAINGWTWGSSETHERTYDQNGRLIRLSLPDISAAQNLFAYDSLNRLTEAEALHAGTQNRYLYDATGNRTGQVENGTYQQYQTDRQSNKLIQVTGIDNVVTASYEYDETGSTTSRTTQEQADIFRYDERGRLTQANQTTYKINALNLRVEKATPNQTTHFVYDEQGHLIGEYDQATGSPIIEHVWLNDWPVAAIKNQQIYYVYPDHLGTPRAITDNQNNVVWYWNYDEPFGKTEPNDEISGQTFTYNLRFPGQYFDIETGLHYNWHRDYEAGTGRYVQSDPIGLEGGINTYAYAGGKPIKLSDPKGTYPAGLSQPIWDNFCFSTGLCMPPPNPLEPCCDEKKLKECTPMLSGIAGSCASCLVSKNPRLCGVDCLAQGAGYIACRKEACPTKRRFDCEKERKICEEE